MASHLFISEIRPLATDWRANILVLQKGNITTTRNTKRLQKMVLMDSKGNKVLALLWDGNVDLFRNTLSPFKTYCIGGATVSPIKDEYLKNSPGMMFQWTISRSTYLCPVNPAEGNIAYPKIPYVSCTDMLSSVGTDTRIDLFAVVLDVKIPQEKPVRGKPTLLQECTIMQQELRPMILTLWGSFIDVQGIELLDKKDKYPILLAKNIIASDFTGIALATTPASFIAIDPDLPQATEFRTWVSDHKTIIENSERVPTRETFQNLCAFSTNEPIVHISEIVPDTKNVWVEVQLMIERTRQQLTHTSCPKCMYTITATPGENYYCFICQCHQTAKLSCKVRASMTDQSDTVTVTMFDTIAEQILKKTSAEMHNMTEQAVQELLHSANARLANMTINAHVRAQKKRFDDNKTRYTIQQLHFQTTDESNQQAHPNVKSTTDNNEKTGSCSKLPVNDKGNKDSDAAGKTHGKEVLNLDTGKHGSTNALAPTTPVKKMKVTNA